MNLKDFLIDNYIYIVIVIVLIIITIIGFLADKKKNSSKKTTDESTTNQGYDPNAGGQINYQPNSNMPMGDINNTPINGPINLQMNNNLPPVNNQINQPVLNNNIGAIPQPMNNMNLNINNPSQPSINNVNAPQPIEPMNNIPVNPEPIYQPLAEQPSLQNNNDMSQAIKIPDYNQVEPMINNPGVIPNVMNEVVNNPNASGIQQPVPTMEQNTPIQPINNGIPNGAGPMPINNPIPQANPVPIPNPTDNTIPNPITPPQPANPTPVGFVFGPQSNNNNNM